MLPNTSCIVVYYLKSIYTKKLKLCYMVLPSVFECFDILTHTAVFTHSFCLCSGYNSHKEAHLQDTTHPARLHQAEWVTLWQLPPGQLDTSDSIAKYSSQIRNVCDGIIWKDVIGKHSRFYPGSNHSTAYKSHFCDFANEWMYSTLDGHFIRNTYTSFADLYRVTQCC